jgi:hypothetical protein
MAPHAVSLTAAGSTLVEEALNNSAAPVSQGWLTAKTARK